MMTNTDGRSARVCDSVAKVDAQLCVDVAECVRAVERREKL